MLLCAVYSRFYYHQMIRSYKPLTTPLCWISLKFSRQCKLSILRALYRSTWIFVSLIVSIYNLNFSMAVRQNHIEISVIYRILTIRKFKMNKLSRLPHKKRWPDICENNMASWSITEKLSGKYCLLTVHPHKRI